MSSERRDGCRLGDVWGFLAPISDPSHRLSNRREPQLEHPSYATLSIKQTRRLLRAHSKNNGVLSAIVDSDESILVAVEWQDTAPASA